MPRTGGEKRKSTLVEEAIRQFGREGYNGASLDQIATAVGVRKQTLLYYFPTKDALLEACLSAAGERLVLEIAQALEGKETYWDRAEAVIHSVFSLAEQWPEFPMFIREAGRLGPDAFARFAGVLDPLRLRAIDFLQIGDGHRGDPQAGSRDVAVHALHRCGRVAHRGERAERGGGSGQGPRVAQAPGARGDRVRARRDDAAGGPGLMRIVVVSDDR